jgi:hypothetical protein
LYRNRNDDWDRNYNWVNYDSISPYSNKRRHVKPIEKKLTDEDEEQDEIEDDSPQYTEW